MKKRFPYNVFQIKFEQLALDTLNSSKELFKELNIDFSKEVVTFLKTHTSLTTSKRDDPYSTIKNSKKAASHWISELSIKNISEIQNACGRVLNIFNYTLINVQ
ncbi:secreted protein-like protein [Leptotrombidium deliense]|uniref:Secreted protein-like protein n=1 Tax=Leptotrombidium deliense TaxID=299467 RepID=A0A443RYH4_9ACAR|nr:secreted protein-like protein [Leptotrombidium deliense]